MKKQILFTVRQIVLSVWLKNLFTIVLSIILWQIQIKAQNPIVAENIFPGNPSSEWDISGAGDLSIQGFTTDISVNTGGTINFKIDVDPPAEYTIKIYRLGYYQGHGARLIVDLGNFTGVAQPDPEYDVPTGKTDCNNWSSSASWTATSAVSGIFIAKLTRADNGGSSHIAFVVRDDSRNAAILFKTSDATWQAYNGYGGNSLYVNNSGTSVPGFNHATKVSYNRPFTTRGGGGGSGTSEDWLFNAEYPMIRWLEGNGYDVSYTTDLDMSRDASVINPSIHKVLLSVGHDEYWSAAERSKFETAQDNGVHLAFFSGNEIYWKTRWEDNYRTMVCYKEGTLGENQCGFKCDVSSPIWTGLWRDGSPDVYPGSDGGKPENALSGQISWDGSTTAIQVPDTYKNHRFWRNTSIASLVTGQTATLPDGTLGYEWDWEQYFDHYPPGRIILSQTTYGSHTHKLSLYRHASGALVFGAGTVQWSWGLDQNHDRGSEPPSLAMQQATVNLFADMGVQPATLQNGLTSATASNDVTPAVSVITSPTSGTSFSANAPVTISGTATDAGGIVAGVDVSVDGGLTWKSAAGTTSWTFTWTPLVQGEITIKSHAFDDTGNIEALTTSQNIITIIITEPVAPICPCTIWTSSVNPTNITENDNNSYELGVKFRSNSDGYITGVRFYKSPSNTGIHIGNLWSVTGTNLAQATFINETASGWQEVIFGNPVQITAGTTYIASYHTTTGYYSQDYNYFGSAGYNSYYLEALQDNTGNPNGVYAVTPNLVSTFPSLGYQASNYWVDVKFETNIGPDVSPPVIVSVIPSENASGVPITIHPTVTFNEALDPLTVNTSSVLMFGPESAPVAGTVAYAANTITYTPNASLDYNTTYTLTLPGVYSDNRIKDIAGNGLSTDYSWSFTTSSPPPPPPTEGPGGPILVISSSSNPFSRYPVEILRAEGFNEFFAMDISEVTVEILNTYDVVILGEFPLSSGFITTITDWVNAGGLLVAFRPDEQLSNLLGITFAGGTLSDKYLLVNTSSGPGVGIVAETIQFHSAADLYTLTGATSLATLYSDATTPTIYPAVTEKIVGSSGGKAYAFTYDLARSVVYTHQGNPSWAGQKRDGAIDPRRSDDMFYGNASFDPQPDWIDLNKVAIPQADEQQHLLSNIIVKGTKHRKIMPRFWFLPKGLKAAIVMTGDDHGDAGMAPRFEVDISHSPEGCSVDDWECVRSTGYLYLGNNFSNEQALYYNSLGFETAIHINTNCSNFNLSQYEDFVTNDLTAFGAKYTGIPAPATNRNHCIAWPDWSTVAEVSTAHGIRLDVNYYYWPNYWTLNRPGMFTGSGNPMRFAKLDGTIIDCYQVVTQMQDEGQYTPVTPYPQFCDALLEKALGPEGYYGVFATNMHFDNSNHAGANAITVSAQAHGIPVVSAKQMLEWLDGRNSSSYQNLTWDGTTMTFTINVGAGANNLKGMLPVLGSVGKLVQLTRDNTSVSFTKETIKGIEYAFFPANAGSYNATYGVDNIAPIITDVTAIPHADGTATITWTTDEPADSRVDYGLTVNELTLNSSSAGMVTSHSILLNGMQPSTVYYFRVTSKDETLPPNSATYPATENDPLIFTMPAGICAQDQTKADFDLGTTDANTIVNMDGDGAVILKPVFIEDFSGGVLPAGWSEGVWSSGGETTYNNGQVIVNGTHIANSTSFGPGSSLEFMATYTAGNFQNIGFSTGADFGEPWVVIGRAGSSGSDVLARTIANQTGVSLGSNLLNTPHNYRIKWNAGNFQFYVDGTLVHTMDYIVSTNMVIQISDYETGTGALSVDWLSITPYATSGSFSSRVFYGGEMKSWQAATWNADVPANTTFDIFVRTGNTSVPDGSWSSYVQVPFSGSIIGQESQYIQYRADLATTNTNSTPVLKDISFTCTETGPDVTPPVISNIVTTPFSIGTATISWTTDEPSNSKVEYGTDAENLSFISESPASVTSHVLNLIGLSTGITYYFRVTSANLAELTATSPESPATMSFIVPFPDVTPPVILNVLADPETDGTVTITWTTDEPANSQVDYGLTASLGSDAGNSSHVQSHSIQLTNLSLGETYYYRVSSSDVSNNQFISPNPPAPPLSFNMPVVMTNCFVDQTHTDFIGGTGTNTLITNVTDGEVMLIPAVYAEFEVLPPEDEWKSYQWTPPNGSSTVSGGILTIDGTRFNSEPESTIFGPGRSLEFVATYGASAYQHVGFGGGTDLLVTGGLFTGSPWAMFSTGTGSNKVMARTSLGSTFHEVDFTGNTSLIGTSHRYRIDWKTDGSFEYFVDGVSVVTETLAITTGMRPGICDYNYGGSSLMVDWIHLTPYSSSGTFESRVYNASEIKNWGSTSWTSDIPVNTNISISVRNGNTPIPDATWSSYFALSGSGANVGGTSQYIQYKAVLTTNDVNSTPVLRDITFQCINPESPDITAPSITNIVATPHTNGTSATITWQTDEASDSRVDFGTSPESLIFNASNTNAVFSHTITLSGLTPLTTYYYRVTANDIVLNSTTAPIAPATNDFTTQQGPQPPVITNVEAKPNADGVSAIISWQTNELADSRVDYGTEQDNLNLTAINSINVTSHSISLTGLITGTTYYFRVTSKNLAGLSATSPNPPSPPGYFTPLLATNCFVDETQAQFNTGITGTNTIVIPDEDGGVSLKPWLNEEFSSASAPTGWTNAIWDNQSGAQTTFSGQQVTVNGTHLSYNTSVGPGTKLEFYAIFTAGNFQNIGFTGDAAFNAPWIVIGRGNAGDNNVYARNSNSQSVSLGSSLLNTLHKYSIQWSELSNNFQFYVDDVLIPTPSFTQSVSTNMFIQISDYPAGGVGLTVDWIRATPFVTSGEFVSRIYNAGAPRIWVNALWTSAVPTGTTLQISQRQSNSSTSILTEPWAIIPSNGDAVGGTNQYIQYRADFTTSDTKYTPVLKDIVFTCTEMGTSAPLVTIHPASQQICEGSNVNFNSTATGSPGPTVQWQVSSNGIDWTNIDGATTSPLSFVVSISDNGKQYHAVWTNIVGSVTSNPVTLTVNPAPTATIAAVNNNLCPGDNIQLKLNSASGASPYNLVVNGNTYSGIEVNQVFADMNTAEHSIWVTPVTPVNPTANDGQAIELGVKFRSSVSGFIKGIRFYNGNNNGGSYTGNLWMTNGTLLASEVFSNVTTNGWQEVRFSNPVNIAANTTYIASYLSSSGYFAITNPGLVNPVVSPPLTALAAGTDGPNGVYKYGGGFPDGGNNANYFVDVIFSEVDNDLTFNLTSVADNNGCYTLGNPISTVTLTINPQPAGTIIPASPAVCAGEDYNLIFNASAGVGPFLLEIDGTTYTNITNGTPFTAGVATYSPIPMSIWSPGSTGGSQIVDVTETELGLKVKSSLDGTISGIRFYKTDPGEFTFTGSLWAVGNTTAPLAMASYTSDNSTGWKQIDFTNPVSINANTGYIASYFSPAGNHYAYTANGLTTPFVNAPLTAEESYYKQPGPGYPTTVSTANYWVDVVFSSSSSISNLNLTAITSAAGCSSTGNPLSTAVVTVYQISDAASSISGISNIEAGTSTTLTVVGGNLGTDASWKWYSGTCGGTLEGTGTSITVSPLETTDYFIRAEGLCNTTTCAQLTVLVTHSMTIWTGNISTDWSIDGNWSNGVPVIHKNAFIPLVLTNQPHVTSNPTSPALCHDLTIEAGAVLTIDAGKALTVNGVLANNAGISGLVILSDASGSGSLIENSGAYASIKRFLTSNRWHYISPTVDNPAAAVFMGLYMMQWNEPSGQWSYISDPNYIMATDMQGYAIWANNPSTVTFSGMVNSGPRSFIVTNTFDATHENKGYNFAGNPYPSSLDWNVNDGNGWTRLAGNVDLAVYIWNGSQYGAYVKGQPFGTNGVDNIIPPHQGFFVHSSAATGYIAVDNRARIHASNDIYKGSDINQSFLKLKTEGNSGSDEIILSLMPEATVNFDGQFDALKMRGDLSAPQLYSLSKDESELSINVFPEAQDYKVIPLGFEAGAEALYSISVSELTGFESSSGIYLEDIKDNTFTKLEAGTIYNFDANPLDEPIRFLLHLSGELDVTENLDPESNIIVYSFNQHIYIASDNSMNGPVFIYDLQGRKVFTDNLIGEKMKKIDLTGYEGYFIVSFISNYTSVNHKVFLK